MDIPKTLDDWRIFMNGYRDPVSHKANKDLSDRWDDDDEDFFSPMSSGGDGERECGHRKEGGTYAVVPTSPTGTPVDEFLLCKPMPIDAAEYNLSNVGVRLVDVDSVCGKCNGNSATRGFVCPACSGTHKETVTHIFDIIGQEYYPNIADFVEEARRLGVSRRLELEDSKQYARLSHRSRLFCLHHRAIIKNPDAVFKKMELIEAMRLNRAGCPKNQAEHKITFSYNGFSLPGIKPAAPGCSALYWNVLQEGAVSIPEMSGSKVEITSQFSERKLASGTYRGYSLPEGLTMKTELGVFAVFPLGKIEVVDPSGEYGDKVARASSARLDVEAVDC